MERPFGTVRLEAILPDLEKILKRVMDIKEEARKAYEEAVGVRDGVVYQSQQALQTDVVAIKDAVLATVEINDDTRWSVLHTNKDLREWMEHNDTQNYLPRTGQREAMDDYCETYINVAAERIATVLIRRIAVVQRDAIMEDCDDVVTVGARKSDQTHYVPVSEDQVTPELYTRVLEHATAQLRGAISTEGSARTRYFRRRLRELPWQEILTGCTAPFHEHLRDPASIASDSTLVEQLSGIVERPPSQVRSPTVDTLRIGRTVLLGGEGRRSEQTFPYFDGEKTLLATKVGHAVGQRRIHHATAEGAGEMLLSYGDLEEVAHDLNQAYHGGRAFRRAEGSVKDQTVEVLTARFPRRMSADECARHTSDGFLSLELSAEHAQMQFDRADAGHYDLYRLETRIGKTPLRDVTAVWGTLSRERDLVVEYFRKHPVTRDEITPATYEQVYREVMDHVRSVHNEEIWYPGGLGAVVREYLEHLIISSEVANLPEDPNAWATGYDWAGTLPTIANTAFGQRIDNMKRFMSLVRTYREGRVVQDCLQALDRAGCTIDLQSLGAELFTLIRERVYRKDKADCLHINRARRMVTALAATGDMWMQHRTSVGTDFAWDAFFVEERLQSDHVEQLIQQHVSSHAGKDLLGGVPNAPHVEGLTALDRFDALFN